MKFFYFVIFIVIITIILEFIKSYNAKQIEKQEAERIRLETAHKLERRAQEMAEREKELERLRTIRNSLPTSQSQIKVFSFEEAVDVYLKTDHCSCKTIYDRHRYFEDAFECIRKNIKSCDITLSSEKVLRNNQMDNPIDETKNITKATKRSKIQDFIAIDTETTGLKCGGNDIIEICAIKFISFKPVEKFHTYLKPRKDIPAEATAINKITNEMVADAPTFSQIKSSLQEFINDYPLVAHNAPFDIKFLHVSGLDLEKHLGKVYDTLKLAKLKLRDFDGSKYESYKLGDLCSELNIGCSSFHGAESDALACALLFIDIIKAVHDIDNIDDFV